MSPVFFRCSGAAAPRSSGWPPLALAVGLLSWLALDERSAAPQSESPAQQTLPLQWPAAFRSKLGTNSWQGQSLRRAIRNLTASEEIAIVLDRRVDPDQTIDTTLEGSLDRRLTVLAGQLQLGVCLIDQVVYLGPPGLTRRLATVIEIKRSEVRKASTELARQLARSQPFGWQDLDTPRELIDRLGREAEIRIDGLEKVPHDLWAGNQLPPLSVAKRLSLVLAGFDLTFQVDSDPVRLRLVSLPPQPAITRRYPVRVNRALTARLQRDFPRVALSRTGSRTVVTGPLEAHQQLRRWLSGDAPPPSQTVPIDAQRLVFEKLTLRNVPAEQALAAICRQAGWSLVFDPRVGQQRRKLINLVGERVPLTRALDDVLQQAGLRCELEGKQLRIELRGATGDDEPPPPRD